LILNTLHLCLEVIDLVLKVISPLGEQGVQQPIEQQVTPVVLQSEEGVAASRRLQQ
jgi:hypothetical protein